MHKLLFIGFLLLGFAGIASANHIDFPDTSIEYGEDNIYIECDGSSSRGCPETSAGRGSGTILTFSACGESTTSHISRDGNNYIIDGPAVPYGLACSVGDQGEMSLTYEVCDPRCSRQWRESGGSLTVNDKGVMNPHVADNIVVNYNPSNNEIRAFQLTDNTWDDIGVSHSHGSYSSSGNIMVQYHSTGVLGFNGQRGVYNSRPGLIAEDHSALSALADDYNNHCPGEDTCDVIDETFKQSSSNFAIWSGLDTISPLHDGPNYRPEGDIIYAEYPEYYVSGMYGVSEGGYSGEGPYFFVCREGAEMWNGEENVDQVVYHPGNEILAQCDPYSNEWEFVEQCEDDLDNDGDGQIDYPDDDKCASPSGSETSENPCPEVAVMSDVDYGSSGVQKALVAQNWDSSEDRCNTDVTIPSDSEDVHSNWFSEPELQICDESAHSFENPFECGGIDYGPYSEDEGGPGEMPIAIYYANKTYFEQLAIAQGTTLAEGVETDFVGTLGWDERAQTLYQAEMTYDGGASDTFCSDCQNYSTWEDRIKEPEVSDAYDTSALSLDNIRKAWNTDVIYNAGAQNIAVQSNMPSGEGDTDLVFNGGFAGTCTSGERWQYVGDENEWRCSGNLPWDQPVLLPQSDNDDLMGLMIMHTNLWSREDFEDSADIDEFRSFPSATSLVGLEDVYGELDEVSIKCWPGGLEDNFEDYGSSDVIDTTVDITGDENGPFGVYKEVNHNGDYACEWSYTTTTNDVVSELGGIRPPVEMHREYDEGIDTKTIKDDHIANITGVEESYSDFEEFDSAAADLPIYNQ